MKQPPQQGHGGIDAVPILGLPTDARPGSADDAQPTGDPERGHRGRDAVDHSPPPLFASCATLPSLDDVLSREAQVLGRARDEMVTRHGDERGVKGVGEPRVVRDPVGEVPQPYPRATSFHLLGDDALHGHVCDEHGVQKVSRGRGRAQRRIGDFASLRVSLRPVSPGGQPATVDPQGDTRQDVGDDGSKNHQRLEREGLVIGPCQEQVPVTLDGRLGHERDQGGVGVVHAKVERGRDHGVFLYGTQYVYRSRWGETQEIGGGGGGSGRRSRWRR